MMGAERRSMVMTEDEKKLTAYHEAGHALCMLYAEGHEPLHKVTIIPRGRALGITMFLPERDKYSQSKIEIKAMVASLFGGRVAEELIFGPDKVTTGAADDIRRATESGAPHGHRVRFQREARTVALQRERGGGVPRPLGHPAQERLRRDGEGHRRGDPPHRRRRRADGARNSDSRTSTNCTRWQRVCSNTRRCRPRRSGGSSRASGSCARPRRVPRPTRRAREGAARCHPPAGRPVSNPSRNRAAEKLGLPNPSGGAMTRKLFGTDGIRGTANSEPMTPETALKVAMAVGECFQNGAHKHLVVIGKDTRLSGYMLEPALTAGFVTMGMDVVLVGPLPTPAIAMLTRSLRADLGVVLSASHNPYGDNGIKLFGRDGYKLSDELELKIEDLPGQGAEPARGPGGARAGQAARRRGWPLYRVRQAELSARVAARRAAHRRRLRPWRRLQGRPDGILGARRRGLLARRIARRSQHQPRVRCVVARADAARGVGAAGRYRDRTRRRCRSADRRR